MSSSLDDGFLLDDTRKPGRLSSSVSVPLPQDCESLLSNSYDDQIHLIEQSVAAVKNEGTNTKKSNPKKAHDKPSTKNNKEQAVTKNSPKVSGEKQQTFTNRSRIYRYDANQADETNPVTKPPLHPPLDVPSSLPDDETDTRSAMLMAWYMAGYHTGYYEAMKKYNKSSPNQGDIGTS